MRCQVANWRSLTPRPFRVVCRCRVGGLDDGF